MEPDVHPSGWTEAFYVTTFRDATALRELHYKPRGQRRHGPFTTYGDAELYAQQIQCTHYSVSKVKVAPNIHPPFMDQAGNLIQQEIPFGET